MLTVIIDIIYILYSIDIYLVIDMYWGSFHL